MTTIHENLRTIRQHLPPHVSLVAVSKMQSPSSILRAYYYGQRDFAESRPQELLRKSQSLPKDIRWHYIGHLQTNKIKIVAPLAYIVQSIDSEHLIMAIEQFCSANDSIVRCLLQVHIAEEPQKMGFLPNELLDFFENNKELNFPHLKIVGLMCIATNTMSVGALRSEFSQMNYLFQQIRNRKPHLDFTQLSMGMSSDYRVAIEEGSTMVRIGSAIFGDRTTIKNS